VQARKVSMLPVRQSVAVNGSDADIAEVRATWSVVQGPAGATTDAIARAREQSKYAVADRQ
jgi:hypothetical protein